jgi:hypothetical protein
MLGRMVVVMVVMVVMVLTPEKPKSIKYWNMTRRVMEGYLGLY